MPPRYPAGPSDPIAGFRWYDTRVMTILTNVTFANYVYEPSLGVGRQSVWFSMVHRWDAGVRGERGGAAGSHGTGLAGLCRLHVPSCRVNGYCARVHEATERFALQR